METQITPFDTPTHRETSDAEKYSFREKLFGDATVYPMWVADMEFEAAPAIKEALKKRVEHGVFGYAMPDEKLIGAASSWLAKRHSLEVATQYIRVSPSIMTSMSVAIEVLSEAGEGVTTFVPVYTPFMDAVSHQERTLHVVELRNTPEGFSIDYEALDEALAQSKLLLLCNPHNPVGRVWNEAELKEIASLCQKHEVTIISDDAHCDLVMPSHRYRSITSISEDAKARTLTLFGAGKGFNISGLATTFFYTHNPEILHRMDEIFRRHHIVRGQMMGYQATLAAYTQGEAWLDQLIPYLDHNLSFATQELNSMGLGVHKSEGTYLLWIDCRSLGLRDGALKDFFVHKAGLGLSLGRLFGKGGQGHMRMNCALPFARLKQALADLKEALELNR